MDVTSHLVLDVGSIFHHSVTFSHSRLHEPRLSLGPLSQYFLEPSLFKRKSLVLNKTIELASIS